FPSGPSADLIPDAPAVPPDSAAGTALLSGRDRPAAALPPRLRRPQSPASPAATGVQRAASEAQSQRSPAAGRSSTATGAATCRQVCHPVPPAHRRGHYTPDRQIPVPEPLPAGSAPTTARSPPERQTGSRRCLHCPPDCTAPPCGIARPLSATATET